MGLPREDSLVMLKALLQGEGVHTANHGSLERIIQTLRSIQEQGREKLLVRDIVQFLLCLYESLLKVIADFDMTLTQYHANGRRGMTSYGKIIRVGVKPHLIYLLNLERGHRICQSYAKGVQKRGACLFLN